MKRVYQGLTIALGIFLSDLCSGAQTGRSSAGRTGSCSGAGRRTGQSAARVHRRTRSIQTPNRALQACLRISTAKHPATCTTSPRMILPDPYATKSSAVFSRPVPRGDMWPQAPAGFKVELWAESLKGDDGKPIAPRTIITAPNGDFFVAAQNQGEVIAFHTGPDGKMAVRCPSSLRSSIFPSVSRFILPVPIRNISTSAIRTRFFASPTRREI